MATKRRFGEMRRAQEAQGKLLCIGLDPDMEKLPSTVRLGGPRDAIVAFNRAIIDATRDIAGSYKPNSAFYESYGDAGVVALRETVRYILDEAPDVPVILDAKRGDIGNTNDGYVRFVFDYLAADAITVHPYMGRESLEPFLERGEKGIFVLCKTSNRGAGEFQDLAVPDASASSGESELYQVVARSVASEWNTKGNCGLVVGATYPEELRAVRAIAPELPILIPGIGAQNGDLARAARAGKRAEGGGILLAVGRAILYASGEEDFAAAARKEAQKLHDSIQKVL